MDRRFFRVSLFPYLTATFRIVTRVRYTRFFSFKIYPISFNVVFVGIADVNFTTRIKRLNREMCVVRDC